MAHIHKRARLEGLSHNKDLERVKDPPPAAVSTQNDTDTGESEGGATLTTTVFLVKEGIQEKRFGLIQKFVKKNGFICENQLSGRATHVVTELKDLEQLCRLHPSLPTLPHTRVVSSQWLYAHARQKTHVSEAAYLIPGYTEWRARVGHKLEPSHATTRDQHRDTALASDTAAAPPLELQNQAHTELLPSTRPEKFDKEFFNNNTLERNASLDHCNPKLVEPLSFLSDYWTSLGDEQRALAYATAAATLKCLPFTATAMTQIMDLKGLGSGHCLKVLQETLDTGTCQEVTAKKDSEKYKRIKSLTGVYGIGTSLSEKLHTSHNITSVADVIVHWDRLGLHDERIKYGVAYYDDLNAPVTREMAERIRGIVWRELDCVGTECRLELTGGFRRGKTSGHDVDLLVGSECGKEEAGLLAKLVYRLRHSGLVLQARLDRPANHDELTFRKQSDSKVRIMDNFEKCFCILKCPLRDDWTPSPTEDTQKTDFASLVNSGVRKERWWRATRVDLVFVPRPQWPYAVLGWTGSKLFLRLLRRYASTSLGLTLTSHGLWDQGRGCLLPATTEEEIFAHLGLNYKHPTHRNF